MRIFIGYDSTQAIAYDVLKYSIERNSKDRHDIRPLYLPDLQRWGFNRLHDPLQSTEFTYSRFLVPNLCDYDGTALFMDCDMLCLGDISELAATPLGNYAIRVVKHEHQPTTTVKMNGKVQTQYPRKNWSSLMLMDCSKLTCWTKEAVESMPAKWLHRFEPIPDEQIGELDGVWNSLDFMNEDTKMIHYTEGGPWLRGYEHHPYGSIWLKYKEEFIYG